MSAKPDRSGEFDLIAKYFAPLAKAEPGALGLKDDAAYLRPQPGHDLVVTTDAVIAGVHFFKDDPADAIAQKALRVNISDLAAKGATPRAYLLTAAFPRGTSDAWVKLFAAGLKRDQKRYGVTLIGGDTTATPGPLTLNIVAIGDVPQGKMLTRAGARPGDDVWVTGTIGDATLGLNALKGELHLAEPHRKTVVGRFLLPEPKPSVGQKLIGIAHACLDVSDGLIADAGHIATASGVSIRLSERDVPLSAAAKAAIDKGVSFTDLLTGGDDYELAFTAPVTARPRLQHLAKETAVRLTRIGSVAKGKGVTVLGSTGNPVPYGHGGYTHF
jgi:thiamine-monophosphate kinase